MISDLAKGAILQRERDMKRATSTFVKAEIRPAFELWKMQTVFRNREVHEVDGDALGGDTSAPIVEEAPASAPASAPTAAGAKAAVPKDRLSAIAEAGGIVPLVGLVTTGNAASKERAASALWHLSVDPANQVAVAKASGIPPLVQLLDDGTEQAHQFAADALDRLAQNNDVNQLQMAKKLVGLLGATNPGAQRRAAHTLWELATNHEGAASRVVDAGAISPLVALLGSGGLEAKEEAAGALGCLAESDVSNQLAIATGLVGLLGLGSALAQEFVTKMLIQFSQDSDLQRGARICSAIVEAGAIERLILQMKDAQTSLRAKVLAATMLSLLAIESDANVASIAQLGGIKILVALMASESLQSTGAESSAAQARSAAVLAAMARSSKEVQTIIAADGAVEPLVALLSETVALDARSEAAGAIWSLSGNNPATQASLLEANAIEPLVQLLSQPSSNAQHKASGALASLATGGLTARGAIAEANGIVPLVALLGEGHVDEVHAGAATALAEIARDLPANQMAVAAAGGIPPLIALLAEPHVGERAKAEAAGALWSLSSNSRANQDWIRAGDGVAPLVTLIGEGADHAQSQAAKALASVAMEHEENKGDVARMVVDLLDSGKAVATKAARAMRRLARACAANQVSMATAGAIEKLVSLLAAEGPRGDSTLQTEIASALWSLADEHATNQAAIAEAGAVPLLVALLSGAPEAHRDAAGALWSLAANVDNQRLIACESGIVPLVRLLKESNPATQETAAGALCLLSETLADNRVMIADADGVAALVAIFEDRGTALAKQQASGALANLVIKNTVNQYAVSRALVSMLGNAATSLLAQEHVTSLMLQLAQERAPVGHADNRGALSKAGAIPLLARQLEVGTPLAMSAGASALSQLALSSTEVRIQVTAELIILLGSDVESVRKRAGGALKDMAAEGGSHSQMSVSMSGGIDRFVSLLIDGSLEAQEYSLWLLWQATDTESKVSIARAGCAQPIIAVLLAGRLSALAQEHAAALLVGLASALPGVSDEQLAANKAQIFACGGIDPLVKLLRSGTLSAKRHASAALANLALPSRLDESAPAAAEADEPSPEHHAADGEDLPDATDEVMASTKDDVAETEEAVVKDARLGSDSQLAIVQAGVVEPLVVWLSDENQGPPEYVSSCHRIWTLPCFSLLALDAASSPPSASYCVPLVVCANFRRHVRSLI